MQQLLKSEFLIQFYSSGSKAKFFTIYSHELVKFNQSH